MRKYIVLLTTRGNPDFGQNPRRPLYGVRDTRVEVDTLREASAKCRAWIAANSVGGGNWTGGEVIDAATDRQVAYISYNGRAWKPGPWPQPEIDLSKEGDSDA